MNHGHEIVIIDNLSNSDWHALDAIQEITQKKAAFVALDLTDKQALTDFFKTRSFGGTIHFAAFKAVGESMKCPMAYYRNNVLGMMNLLEFGDQLGSFIFSSSCTVYGLPDALPIDETAPLKPSESPYGETKRMGEAMLKDWAVLEGHRAIALRYFNPVGAHPSGLIGEKPVGVPGNLLPYLTQTAAGIRESLRVFGQDYDTRDGTCIRDYID
ncbi:unnamed protein product, partial [Notodromas monacha]